MALAKMEALAAFLLAQNIFPAEQFDYVMTNGKNAYANKRIGNGLLISRFRYDAVFLIERYSQDADLFLALISTWLMENDNSRDEQELEMPDVGVTALDDFTVDLEVRIVFEENITIVPDEVGKIIFNGSRYSVLPAVISDAIKVGVGDSQERLTDKPYELGED